MNTKNTIRVQFKNGSHLQTPRVDIIPGGIRVWTPIICDDQFALLSEIAGAATSRLRPEGNEIISIEFNAEHVSSMNASAINA